MVKKRRKILSKGGPSHVTYIYDESDDTHRIFAPTWPTGPTWTEL